MTWPLPLPEDIAGRAAATLELRFPDMDARSPNTGAGVLAATIAQSTFDVWLDQRRQAEEMLPDTAVDRLEQHAGIWIGPRLTASAASGVVRFAGTSGTLVPIGVSLRSATGARFTTTTGGTIGGGGTLDVEVLADEAGTAGNAAAAAVLDLVSPIAGLSPQSVIVQAPGLTGGRATETDDALRARMLARIRQPPAGGAAHDFEAWAREAVGIGYVSALPNWMGPGSVGVIIALDGPIEAEPGDVTRVEDAIEARRPITATVYVVAATLLPVALTIDATPDTVPVRNAITAALQLFFRTEAQIGASVPLSRISEAISSASGEYSHRITSPVVDVAPTATQLAVLGTVTWA